MLSTSWIFICSFARTGHTSPSAELHDNVPHRVWSPHTLTIPCQGGPHGRVAIVGAGVAGLAAAQSLYRAGCEVIVFEAYSEPGGRASRRVQQGAFSGEEFGAQWIHGGEDNLPLAEVLRFFNLSQLWVGGDSAFQGSRERLRVFDNGKELSKETKELGFKLYSSFHDPLIDQVERLVWLNADVSLETAWDAVLSNTTLNETELALLLWQRRTVVGQSIGADLERTGARLSMLGGYTTFAPVESHRTQRSGDTVVAGGYGRLVDKLASDLDLRLRMPVQMIEHSEAGVIIHTPSETFPAAAAIVAVSSGAMQAGAIVFNPALPLKKTEAFGKLRMAEVTKIFLRFSEESFPVRGDAYLISRLVPRSVTDAIVTYCVSDSPPTLVCFATGAAAARAETLAAQGALALRERVLVELREMFPSLQDSALQAVDVASFNSDPFVRGAWVYPAVGASSLDLESVAEPVGRLLFAGDAACRLLYGTVHGAMVSGASAAFQLLPVALRTQELVQSWPLLSDDIRRLCEQTPRAALRRPPVTEYDKEDEERSKSPICTDAGVGRGTCAVTEASMSSSGVARLSRARRLQEGWTLLHVIPSLLQDWHSMAPFTRELWQQLGWNHEAWDLGLPMPPCVECPWNELSNVGKLAASSLGFTEELWESVKDWSMLVSVRITPSIRFAWDFLEDAERIAWEALGWSRAVWDEGIADAKTRNRTWASLSEPQRQAAQSLGYVKSSWDGRVQSDPNSDSLCQVLTQLLPWEDLPETARSAWQLLGYGKRTWNNRHGDEQMPGSNEATWKNLRPDQRLAAQRLGYTADLWDDDD